jgi:molecular chaperone GrpE
MRHGQENPSRDRARRIERAARRRAGAGCRRARQLREERDRYLASWQRAQADYQNLKRRTLSDIERERKQAKRAILEDLLLVLDHLEMALAQPCETDEGKQVQAGVELTRAQILAVLERENVHPLPAQGTFDPAVHEAVAALPAAGVAPGELVEVVRRGYRWGDDVLRHARVIVAAEPMKGASNATTETD